jgi:hypothetical protein
MSRFRVEDVTMRWYRARPSLESVHSVVVTIGFLIVAAYAFYNVALAAVALRRASVQATTAEQSTPDTPKVPGEVDVEDARYTVITVIRSTCRFCTDSMPFYRRLAARRSADVRFVVACVEPLAACTEYLNANGVVADQIVDIAGDASSFGITATPTILVVDRQRQVAGTWRGLQQAKGENEIYALLE